MDEAHILSNGRPSDPPVLACSCGMRTPAESPTVTVATPCEPLMCWRCGAGLCGECREAFEDWRRRVTS